MNYTKSKNEANTNVEQQCKQTHPSHHNANPTATQTNITQQHNTPQTATTATNPS
jgi:hypothetical protein